MEMRRHRLPVANATDDGKHELVFYDWGDVNAKRTVMCVHGLTRNAQDFAILAEALVNSGRRVFSLNMAGRGESAWLKDPMGYTYGAYVADCLAVMSNFHLRGVEWIGTSMGGIIGMMIAAQQPDRIRKLVLNDIGIHLSRESLMRIYEYVRSMPAQFANRAEASAYLAQVFAPFKISDPVLWERFVDSSLLSNVVDGVKLACDPAIAVPLAAATQEFTEIGDVNLASVWEDVDVPTLIIRGSESDILSAETVRAMRATNIHADAVTVQGVGHAPPLMVPEQIRLVTTWLAGSGTGMMASGL